MNIPQVQQNRTSFQAIKINQNIPESVAKAIQESNAFKKFGKNYDADVFYAEIADVKAKNITHPGLIVEDIKPVSRMQKIINKLKNIDEQGFFFVSTHGKRQEDLSAKLLRVEEDYVINKYKHLIANK